MIERQGASRGELREDFVRRCITPYVTSELVLNAFKAVDRGDFTPFKDFPYDDNAILLGEGSSLSQPSLVASMINLLNPNREERILDVGTGSGYTAAVLSWCAKEVHTIDYDQRVSEAAAQRLAKLGFDAVRIHTGDGAKGVVGYAPYDAILVTAGIVEIPQALFDQLKDGGRIIAPTIINKNPTQCTSSQYDLHVVYGIKQGNTLRLCVFYSVGFHKLTSDEHGGWSPQAIDKKRSYEIIFDDKTPKKLHPAEPRAIGLYEENEDDTKHIEANLKLLESFGMTQEEFLSLWEQQGMEKPQARTLLSLHPESFENVLSNMKAVRFL